MVFIKRDGRHSNWARPFFVMVFLFATVITGTVLMHDWVVDASESYGTPEGAMLEKGAPPLRFSPVIAYFFLAYVFVMTLSRYLDCGAYIFYEMAWCCNSGLLMAALGMLTNRPLLVGASVAGVCCDQLMWYLDCAGYLVLGKFKIGVAKYLVWPETSWSKKYLCTHHLWFMPLTLYALGWHFPVHSFLLSCWFTSLSTGLSRYTTPLLWKDEFNKHTHYMNVNAGHEFWRDVKIPILHAFNKSHDVVYLLWMMICVNTGLNGPPFLLINAMMGLLHK
jgi:hypothetical protein